MGRDSHFLTYFENPTVTLDDLAMVLERERPTRDGESLVIPIPDSNDTFQISLSDAPHVAVEARETAQRKRKPGIARCTRRFECLVGDVEAALVDYNTLFVIQERIWRLCDGWMILGWNGNITFEPTAAEAPKQQAAPKQAAPKTKKQAAPKAKKQAAPKAKKQAAPKAKKQPAAKQAKQR